MNTTWIGLAIAVVAATGLVLTLGIASLLTGSLEFLFGRPKLTFLKSANGENGFAFHFKWNSAKEPANFNGVKIKLFNPFGKPSQVEVTREFTPSDSSFAQALDLGPGFKAILNAKGFDEALVEVELYAGRDGVTQSYEMRGVKFKNQRNEASRSIEDFGSKNSSSDKKYGIAPREMIADTVPGRGPKLKLAMNPEFAGEFAGAAAGGAAGEAAPAAENFAITKVWIEPGCIVCNACEDIYGEVFDVQADTCLIKPGAPLDDGLKILEAAEACPVEVIKFTKA